MMLSEHKGALALYDRLSTRPGLPGHQAIKKETGDHIVTDMILPSPLSVKSRYCLKTGPGEPSPWSP